VAQYVQQGPALPMDTATTVATRENVDRFRLNKSTCAKIGLVVGLLAALYGEIVPDLVDEWWTQPESSYGLLIPPIALYIAYLFRSRTFAVPAEPTTRGLWLLGSGCLIFLLGRLSAEFFLARISIVVVLAGLVWIFWGKRRLRTLSFPFVLLATMVPLPAIVYNTLAAPLQLFASAIATDIAQALGISIYRDGNIIHLANISLGVAEACSGLHSLTAMVVAALLLGFVLEIRLAGRIILLLFSVPLAVAINVLRVAGTAVLADYKSEFALGFYHSFSGWLVFVLGFALLWLSGKALFHWTRRVV